jgi:lactoylglutathione lyase
MDITKLDINDIAQNIDMGMLCFIHKETLELVHYPDPEQFYDDIEEHWGEDIKKIEANRDDYVRIKKMDSRASFRIMEDYTATIKNKKLQSQLFNALSNRKPFRNWKHIIDHQDEERENWFKFKQERMEIWVKCHLDPQQKYEAETLYSIMTEKQEPLLQGIRSCIYMVDDLEKATRWYSTAFGIEPDIESKDYVAFNVGGFELGLQLSTTNQRDKVNSIITYWAVEDIEEALYQLQIVGAQEHQEITELGEDKKQASVIDSWGNIIGLICNPNFEIE